MSWGWEVHHKGRGKGKFMALVCSNTKCLKLVLIRPARFKKLGFSKLERLYFKTSGLPMNCPLCGLPRNQSSLAKLKIIKCENNDVYFLFYQEINAWRLFVNE